MNTFEEFTDVLIEELKKKDQIIEKLVKDNEKLSRSNYGLKSKVKNLEYKLYKRNESYKGDVWDKDASKIEWHE